MVAARLATPGDGQRQVGKFAEVPTQKEAAAMLNVSERTMRSATIVRERVEPALQRAVSTSFGGENRHQQHRDCPVSAAGALIVAPFKTKITGLAIAYE
jgi:hypothetical protein